MNRPVPRCDGVTRRDAIRIGGLTSLGLGMADLLALRRASAEEAHARYPIKARSCILIWLDGGPSHLETFDMKPDAPQEVRGPFKPIRTIVPGIEIGEFLPLTAKQMDKIALIRSMTSPLGEHNFGTHYMMTGYQPSPALEYASYGSVVAHLRGGRATIPPNVAVPGFQVGGSQLSGNGFLPEATQPFSVGSDPARDDFRVRDLELFPGVTDRRISRRKRFLDALDRLGSVVETADDLPPDPEFEQAYRLITAPEAKQAFDLSREAADVRQRYGPKSIGQSCLLARRLVERGVPFVTVNNRGWDTHADLVTRLKDGYTGATEPVGLIPSLDRAFAALIDDLDQRGLLEETLVIVMGEFGRTPKLNVAGGRDHWPRVFSVALAGGGIRGGQVVGSSDAVGENPRDRPVTPADLAATIYTLLGINPALTLLTSDQRPIRVVDESGSLIEELV